LKIFAFLSSLAASYAISVRQASVLPAASSGFHLAMDTLAVRLTIPPAGFVEDFHLQMNAPCRAHNTKAETGLRLFFSHLEAPRKDGHEILFRFLHELSETASQQERRSENGNFVHSLRDT
jgi:hypothetical protein